MKISKFSGVNNVDAAERLAKSTAETGTDLREAENVDIDKTFRISRRKGTTQRYSGSGIHSIWNNRAKDLCLFVEGSDLCRLNTDYTKSVLRSGLPLNQHMSYIDVHGAVYYSDGVVTGIISNGVSRTWGVEVPNTQPTLAAVGGSMAAGTYQVAITYVRADGEESGANIANTVVLSVPGGIALSSIPVSADPDVAYVNIYCSPTNGDELYYAGQVANGTTAHTISGGIFTIPLKTQFVSPPPPGSLVEHHYGRMYVAVGDAVFYSEPHAFGHFRLAFNYLHFPAEVTMIGSVKNGMFFSADRTYFMHGSKPEETSMSIVDDSIAVKHTMARAEGAQITGVTAGAALVWVSEAGVCVGGGDGLFRNLTSEKWSIPGADVGAGVIREYNGGTHYLGLLKDTDKEASNAYVGDVATAEIIRQGV